MFLRAGFNLRHRVIAFARVASYGIYNARLIVFEHGGDLAWYCPGNWLNWHLRGGVINLLGEDLGRFSQPYFHRRPCSRWPREESD